MKMRQIVVLVTLLTLFTPYCDSRRQESIVVAWNVGEEAWANLEAELQRRYDLIPNLVATVKKQVENEEDILNAILEATAEAHSLRIDAVDLQDTAKMTLYQRNQDHLRRLLFQVVRFRDRYPDLQTSESFADLLVTIESTENRILRARKEYNRAARNYNTELQRFDGAAINSITGERFSPMIYFRANPESNFPPELGFNHD